MKKNGILIILIWLLTTSTFSQSFLTTFSYMNTCYGDITLFTMTSTIGVDSVLWDFDDVLSGANTSKLFNPGHVFSSPGSYNVTLASYSGTIIYNFSQIVIIFPPPPVDLGPDTTICNGTTLVLDAGSGFTSYLWSTSSTNQTISVSLIGTYSVEVVDTNSCHNWDTINLTLDNPPNVDLGNDTSLCSGDSIILNAGSGFISYLWHDNTTDSTNVAKLAGIYWVEVTNVCGPYIDTLIIDSVITTTFVSLGNDTSVCPGESVIFDPGPGYVSYFWQDGSTNQTYTAMFDGVYWVQVVDICGVATDSVILYIYPQPNVDLGPDSTICSDMDITFDAGGGFASYFWQDGSTAQSLLAVATGLYWVRITDLNGCTAGDSVTLTVDRRPEIELGGTRFMCQNSLVLDAGSDGETYLWNDGTTAQYFTVWEPGIYTVTIANGDCFITDFITIEPCHEIWVPNAFSPNFDGVNDCFQAVGEDIVEFKMYIYNRFGQLVFETEDINECWYGADVNQLAPQGVYHWKIVYKGFGNVIFEEEGIKTGYVVLFR